MTEVTTNTGEKLVDYSKPMGPQKYTEETVKVPRVCRYLLQNILNSFHPGKFFPHFFLSCDFFSKSIFSKNSFRNTILVSNNLDRDQAQCSVRPDLGPTVCKSIQQMTLGGEEFTYLHTM